jgi:hypothetical protein
MRTAWKDKVRVLILVSVSSSCIAKAGSPARNSRCSYDRNRFRIHLASCHRDACLTWVQYSRSFTFRVTSGKALPQLTARQVSVLLLANNNTRYGEPSHDSASVGWSVNQHAEHIQQTCTRASMLGTVLPRALIHI